MVTGEPGSGKSTLGVRLAGALRVPFLSRDQVRGGLLATAGLWSGQLRDAPSREAAVESFAGVVEAMAALGISAVVEFVVTPERVRVEAWRRIEEAARCVVVHTTASGAAARAEARDRVDPGLNRPAVLRALGYGSIDEYLTNPVRGELAAAMQTDFDLPLLRVATDDGYDPPLEAIVDWVVDRTCD